MKKMILVALGLVFLLATGCITTQCPPCPSEEAIVLSPGSGPVKMPKGFLDDRSNWKTQEELDQWLEELEKQFNSRERRKVFNRRGDRRL